MDSRYGSFSNRLFQRSGRQSKFITNVLSILVRGWVDFLYSTDVAEGCSLRTRERIRRDIVEIIESACCFFSSFNMGVDAMVEQSAGVSSNFCKMANTLAGSEIWERLIIDPSTKSLVFVSPQ